MTDWIRTGPRDDAARPHPDGGPACSDAARARAEPLSATASRGERWLLVEVASGWGWNAWTQSPALPPDIGRAVVRRAEAAGMRLVAIRRPGRARGPIRWRWAHVDTRPGRAEIRWGEVATPAELLDVPLDGSTGTATTVPVFAVCAHGRHDECCAVRGRTAAAELAAAYPDETWECSHIGGDRFAGTMILFPHGLNYGRIDDASPVRIADDYMRGLIAPDHFRGRTAYSHVEQAALAAAAAESGDHRIDAYTPTRVTPLGGAPERWDVLLSNGASVEVGERFIDDVLTTCRATRPVQVRRFEAAGAGRAAGAG